MARNKVVESWLLEEVVPPYDALKADPSIAVTANKIRARLADEHTSATTKT